MIFARRRRRALSTVVTTAMLLTAVVAIGTGLVAWANTNSRTFESILVSSAADKLNHALLFRRPEPPARNVVLGLYAALADFHSHKWMYDSDSLIGYFKQAGFVSVCERKFHDSQIEGIANIEAAERVLNGAGICVEGVKPS